MDKKCVFFSVALLSIVTLTYSRSSSGRFCKYKSTKRSFPPNRVITAKYHHECFLRCAVDDKCNRFNFDSRGSLLCEIGYGVDNLTCDSLVRRNSWDYYDKDCEIETFATVNTTENQVIPLCEDGRQCHPNQSGFSCKCPADYKGLKCETKKDPCDYITCLNNGVCVVLGTSAWCNCTDTAFGGKTCEKAREACGTLQIGTSLGGRNFSDPVVPPSVTGFKVGIVLWAGTFTASNFQIRYGSSWAPNRKPALGNVTTVLFDADEYITGIEAYTIPWGRANTGRAFLIFTNKRFYGPYGDISNRLEKHHCLPNERLAYISGKQAHWYDQIRFHFVTV